ncbi:FtsW/RodA/SpoVE family cell cycle protein [Hominifimenecus sp. rT4P-3]|uniref:FtsW/RodA/SpoVE family cell cycle protein n=1 Tax=Hominifimenecus sp. rT4P-3 TaxID=3242979 RepID=UPI003DA3F92D
MFRLRDYKLKKYNFRIVLIIIALCTIGILVLNSAMINDADRTGTIRKQIIGFCAGGTAMVILSLIDYHFILKFTPIIYLGVLGLLGLIFVPGVGVSANNAVRWMSIAGFQIQPSEFAKIGLTLVFSWFFWKNQERVSHPLVVGGSLVLFAIPAVLIYKEPDLSTTLVTVFIFLAIIYTAKISYKWILGAIGIAVPAVGVVLYIAMQPDQTLINLYQINRVLSWLYPDRFKPLGLTVQQDNSVLAIASGQLHGKGLNTTSFESVKNGNFLSEENCDFIFAVIGEELGFIGSVVLIALMAFLVFECLRIASRAKDLAGRLICTGIAAQLAFQTFVNIGVATKLLPNTGLPLPFISAGVSSLLSIFMGMGVVLNIGLQRRDEALDW